MIDFQEHGIQIFFHLTSLEEAIMEITIPQGNKSDSSGQVGEDWDHPVCGSHCIIPLYGFIIGSNDCAQMCRTVESVQAEIDAAIKIFDDQCTTVSLALRGLSSICNSDFMVTRVDENDEDLCALGTNDSLNMFFICDLIDDDGTDLCGYSSDCCVFVAAPAAGCAIPGLILAHELGHLIFQDPAHPNINCNLMYYSGEENNSGCSTINASQCSAAGYFCYSGGCWS
jgi:hypothetical protein